MFVDCSRSSSVGKVARMKRKWFANLGLCALASCVFLGNCGSAFAGHAQGAASPPPGSSETETSPSPLRSAASGQQGATAEKPEGQISDFAWLEGKWQGNWGPRLAEQVWMAPKAREMLGLFRVVENDKTLVVEMYSLLETSDGIELRLRHFTPSLAPWEPSSTTVLRLARLDARQAVFENTSGGQPSRQILLRSDPDSYISRSEITSVGDNQQVTEIHFRKQNPVVTEAPPRQTKSKQTRNSPQK